MQYPHDPVRPASRHSELLGFTEVSAYFDAGSGTSLYPVYVRGEANLAAKQGLAAAAEFQKILDHPGVVQNELIGALAHLGLGRACVLSRDLSKGPCCLPRLLFPLERRRSRCSFPKASVSGVRELQ